MRFFGEFPVRERHEPKWSVEVLTDEEISAAIRYLDPAASGETDNEEGSAQEGSAGIGIWVCLVLLFGYIALICLYRRVF
jgi:hypothetical protein